MNLSTYLPHTDWPSLASHYLHRKNLKPTISLPIHFILAMPCIDLAERFQWQLSPTLDLARSPTCIRCSILRTTGLARKTNFAQWAMAVYYKMPNKDISARYVVHRSLCLTQHKRIHTSRKTTFLSCLPGAVDTVLDFCAATIRLFIKEHLFNGNGAWVRIPYY